MMLSTALLTLNHGEAKQIAPTLPSEASSNLTGHSRTDATKQKDAGSYGEAVGNQMKSRIGAACWRTLVSEGKAFLGLSAELWNASLNKNLQREKRPN